MLIWFANEDVDDVVACRRSGYWREERLRTSAEKYYSTPNVVDLPSADELRFYYDDDRHHAVAGATATSTSTSKDAQTILPLTRVVAAPSRAPSLPGAGCRAADQTSLTDSKAGDDWPGMTTCVCSTAPGMADCGRHQRTVLLVREHSAGYDTWTTVDPPRMQILIFC